MAEWVKVPMGERKRLAKESARQQAAAMEERMQALEKAHNALLIEHRTLLRFVLAYTHRHPQVRVNLLRSQVAQEPVPFDEYLRCREAAIQEMLASLPGEGEQDASGSERRDLEPGQGASP